MRRNSKKFKKAKIAKKTMIQSATTLKLEFYRLSSTLHHIDTKSCLRMKWMMMKKMTMKGLPFYKYFTKIMRNKN